MRIETESSVADEREGLDRGALRGILYRMSLARALDELEVRLLKRGKVHFHIPGAGHEALGVALGLVLRPAHDWFYAYYRDRALMLTLGMTPLEMLAASVGSMADPGSAGRQIPSNWCHPRLNVISRSSCTGTQFLQAAGCAEAGRYITKHDLPLAGASDEIVYCSAGDGTAAQGEFWEAITTIANRSLPVFTVIHDNGYAISVTSRNQYPGGDIAALMGTMPGLEVLEVDATDFFATHRVVLSAAAFIRKFRRPVLLRARVARPHSHSISDDQARYRAPEELARDQEGDCLVRFRRDLIARGLLGEADLREVERDVQRTLDEAERRALDLPPPPPGSATQHVLSPGKTPGVVSATETTPGVFPETKLPMARLVNLALRREMRVDPRVLVFGEDVADCDDPTLVGQLPGKGGVFTVTSGLQREFGHERVFNSPLAEANIVGRAVGLATRGLKPVVEISFFDYIWPAMMQLRSELATMRWRSNGAYTCPAVVRVAIGGYTRGGGMYHSQCGESIFAHLPGLKIAFPSTGADAYGLLREAIAGDDPVLFLEHKSLYFRAEGAAVDPGAGHRLPFGRARVVRPGSDLTLVTWGATVHLALEAATRLAAEGIEIEVLDARTIAPFDHEAVAASVSRTHRALVVHEDTLTAGFGAEIAARLGEHCFEHLDAPVRRIAGADACVGYSPLLEHEVLPDVMRILEAARNLASW